MHGEESERQYRRTERLLSSLLAMRATVVLVLLGLGLILGVGFLPFESRHPRAGPQAAKSAETAPAPVAATPPAATPPRPIAPQPTTAPAPTTPGVTVAHPPGQGDTEPFINAAP